MIRKLLLCLLALTLASAAYATPPGPRRTLLSAPQILPPLLFSQDWDGVTAPALPGNFTYTASPASTTVTTFSMSGPNSLNMPLNNAGVLWAISNNVDTNGGNVIVSTNIQFSGSAGTNTGGVMCRGVGSPSAITNYYYAIMDRSGASPALGLHLYKAGVLEVSVAATLFTNGVPYYLELTCNGAVISVRVRRGADGYWLNSSGVWAGVEAVAISFTDGSPLTGAGYVAMAKFSGTSAAAVNFDDFRVSRVPLTPSTKLLLTPYGGTYSSGIANHRNTAFQVSTDGTLASSVVVSLSDGGAGGRFLSGPTPAVPTSAFATEITSFTLPANTSKFGQTTIWYLPAYNRSTAVTIRASSAVGSASFTYTPTAYTTTGAPTSTNLSFDLVKVTQFNQFWTSLALDISGAFPALPFANYTALVNTGGGGATEQVVAGVYSRQNTIDNTIWYRSNTLLTNPQYQTALTINTWGGGATDQAVLGFAKDSSNYCYFAVNNAAGNVVANCVVAGVAASPGTWSLSVPAGTQFALRIGTAYGVVSTISMFYMRPTDTDWISFKSYNTTSSFNFGTTSVMNTFYPFWGTSQSANTSVKVAAFTAGMPGYTGCVNNSVVKNITNGAPLLTNSSTAIYMVAQCSNVVTGDGGNYVFTVDIRTYAVTEVGRIYLTLGGAFHVGGPLNIGYNPGTGDWTIMSDNWGTVGTTAVLPYYSVFSGGNLMSGVHSGIAMTAMTFPGTATPVTVYDCDILFTTPTYYVACVRTNAATGYNQRWADMASATALNGTFTDIWQSTNATSFDGSRIVQVGGTKYVLEGTGSFTSFAFAFSASPQPSLGSVPNITVDGPTTNKFTDPTATLSSHPSLAAVPGEIGGQTRYLMIGFNEYPVPTPYLNVAITPWSPLMVHEALQRYTSSEFTWINYP